MPNIIRIRNLENETNLDDIVIPVDKETYLEVAKQVSIGDLKTWILSGYTGGGSTGTTSGTSGSSGTSGLDGVSGTSPCITLTSNTITISSDPCTLWGTIDCVT